MLNTKSDSLLAPGIGARIRVFRNNASIPPYIVVENRDLSLSAMVEYQESDNGTTWATVVGTSVSIPPGESNGQVVLSTKAQIALFAQGNVQIEFHLVRNYNHSDQLNIDN